MSEAATFFLSVMQVYDIKKLKPEIATIFLMTGQADVLSVDVS